jgi:hypothetical protein
VFIQLRYRIFEKTGKPRMRKNFLQTVLLVLYFTGSINISVFSQSWRLVQPSWPAVDAFVAAFSVNDYGASGDGVTDVTSIFQARLDALKALGGGVLFVPRGKYVIKGTLVIPKGITLRGEWQKPVKGSPIEGTILMAYTGRGNENATPFITMEPSSAVMDLAIWYPDQLPGSITPYSPAIVFGKPGYFGNEYCNAKNITLVNAYSGVIFSRITGGGCPVINGLYGTPLSRGVEIDNIADVGRTERIDFSPSYWSGSGLPDSPADGGPHATWISQHGTGIVMRRNDWSYTCFVNIEGYNRGFHAGPSVTDAGSVPNGHNYAMTFTNCKTGVYIEAAANVGLMFTKITTLNCDTGILVAPKASGTIQFHTSDIDAAKSAVNVDSTSAAKLMMQQCNIARGNVNIGGGIFTASDCDFNNTAPQVFLGTNGRGLLTGNRFSTVPQIQNNSIFVSIIDHSALNLKKLPSFPVVTQEAHKPSRLALYVATTSPFNARNDGVTDNTSAIQAALDQAFADGGGIVFLPPGKYKVLGNLTVPTGVELKGAVDVSTVPTGPGSVLEVYAGRGNTSSAPFLKLSAGSGLRGVVFNYPEQMYTDLPNVSEYPFCIQVTGSNVYIINVGLRAVYSGIDLFTYKCDNHYIDYLAGHVFKTGINVGGNSDGGKIYNLQFNVIAYACGGESKFGSWPNSGTSCFNAPYNYSYSNLDFMVLGPCTNEILYNDFHYGSRRGTVFSGASGISLGLGVDGSRKSLVFESVGPGGFDFINSQIVSTGSNASGTDYIETEAGFTSGTTFFSSDYWGSPQYGVNMANGTVNFQLANFQNPGQTGFSFLGAGLLNVHNSSVSLTSAPLLNGGAEPNLSAQSSIIDPAGISILSCALWKNNLENSPAISPGATFDRTGWIATASNNNGAAGNGIDGNTGTRWDTQGSQLNGQWYSVDMRAARTFGEVILDVSGSPNDSPAAYKVYVSADGINWGNPVATGTGTNGMTIISFPAQTARYIKIVQTGTKSNYWSVHEFYVRGAAPTEVNVVKSFAKKLKIYPVPAINDITISYSLIRPSGVNIDIYNIGGVLIKSLLYNSPSGEQSVEIDISTLKAGIYMVKFTSKEYTDTRKMVVK